MVKAAYEMEGPVYMRFGRAATPADSPTAILYDWLFTQEGQDLVDAAGYVSVIPPSK